jgi:hypothetical protein
MNFPLATQFGSALGRLLLGWIAIPAVQSPMDWSPDGRWLAYAVSSPESPDSADSLPPGWIFEASRLADASVRAEARSRARVSGTDPSSPRTEKANEAPPPPSATPLPPTRFQIWATEYPGLATVKLAESDGPLGPPAWRPDGKGVAYGRFVRETSKEAAEDSPRSAASGPIRFELIVQDGLDRRRVLFSLPHTELGPEVLESFFEVPPSWSRDGRSLAFHRPTDPPGVVIVESTTGRVRKIVEDAALPSWSPDGARLCVTRRGRPESGQDTIELIDVAGAEAPPDSRKLVTLGRLVLPPCWARDSQSLLVVAWRPSVKAGRRPGLQIDLLRVLLSGESAPVTTMATAMPTPVMPMGDLQRRIMRAPQLASAVSEIRGATFSIESESEDCFYSTEQDGHPASVVWFNARTGATIKRFPPLDVSVRIGPLAASPDTRTLAVRLDPPGFLAPPAFCDPAAESLTMILPDEAARQSWLAALVQTSEYLLAESLPSPAVAGEPARRASVLPVPGEISVTNPVSLRLRRIAKIGRAVCDQPIAGRSEVGEAGKPEPTDRETLEEVRLFFDYLGGDYDAAASTLDRLDGLIQDRDRRLAILGIRAQVLLARGDLEQAGSILDYLATSRPSDVVRVEETPMGYVSSRTTDPNQNWVRYLALRRSELAKQAEAGRGRGTRSGQDEAEEGNFPLQRFIAPGMPRNDVIRIPMEPDFVPPFPPQPGAAPF